MEKKMKVISLLNALAKLVQDESTHDLIGISSKGDILSDSESDLSDWMDDLSADVQSTLNS